jgi:hypothetical protein
MGESRRLSRLVSTDLGPHILPQQSTATAVFGKGSTIPKTFVSGESLACARLGSRE